MATSGNLSEEPICISPEQALSRLGGVADLLLVHDRPIARQVDDSVVALVEDNVQLVRRARGYAPRPLRLREPGPCVLALGPHLKNTIALTVGD